MVRCKVETRVLNTLLIVYEAQFSHQLNKDKNNLTLVILRAKKKKSMNKEKCEIQCLIITRYSSSGTDVNSQKPKRNFNWRGIKHLSLMD